GTRRGRAGPAAARAGSAEPPPLSVPTITHGIMTDHPLLRAVHRVGGATLLLAAMLACSADDGGIGADTSATASAATAAADDTMEERLITVDTTLAEYARYTGELPCDDCEAVRTELRLWTDPHRYLLRETYVG